MTTEEIAKQVADNPNFVPAQNAFRLGQLAAEESDTTIDDNPFASGTRDAAEWEAGFRSVIYAAADAETEVYLGSKEYLGSMSEEPGYSTYACQLPW